MNTITPLEEVKQNLTRMQTDFKMVLPPQISPEKFVRVAMTAAQNTPDLLNANRSSFYNACIKCAQDGLIPDGNEATLTVFKGMVIYIPMIRGVLKKVRNSGELGTVDAQVVYSNDEYESWLDEKGQHFKHKKSLGDRGEPVLTYAYALTKDGAIYFEEISEEQMAKIEAIAKTSHVWKGPFRDEMKRKSALHRLSKRLPMSTDLENVIARDEDMYELPQEPVAPAQPTSSRLDSIVDAQDRPLPEDNPAVAEPEEPNEKQIGEGVVEVCKFKEGETNGKAWVLYGIKIAKGWYNTFNMNLYKECISLKENKVLCHFEYLETEKGKQLLSIHSKTPAEMNIPI